MIRKKLHIEVPSDIMTIHKLFMEAGHKLFLVGGSVRDTILQKKPKDFDLATDAIPDIFEPILKKSGFKTLGTGRSFGVINVFTKSGEFEIATFRKDLSGGRRPDAVEFTTIEEDVKRRDLTINALFFDLETQEVVDLVGGIEDLENGVVRTVGDPTERFDEDPLRKLRAIRFASISGNEPHKDTADAILKNNDISTISKERIRDEFLKGVDKAKSVVFFMELLDKFGFLEQMFPGVKICRSFKETRNPCVLLSQLFKNELGSEAKIRTMLEEVKFFLEVDKVIFLLSFMFNLSINHAFRLKKLELSLNEEKKIKAKPALELKKEEIKETASFHSLNEKLVKAFFEFNLTVKGGILIAEGFKGEEIGKETIRRETENFKAILEKI